MTISVPDLKSVGDVFELHWTPEKVLIRIDHIVEGDSLTGEFTIGLNGTEKVNHLYAGRINMLSVSAKKTFSDVLKKRYDLEWEVVIEQACFKTIEAYRRGEPAVIVGDMPTRVKNRYRLFPWVMEDSMTTLYGLGGSCKSYVAAFLVIMIQTGVGRLGFNPVKGNCLILDWEACQEDWDERIKAIKLGMDIESPELPIYKRCHRILANDILEIQKLVLEKEIKVVIVDSVGMASELSDSYHTSAIQMLRAARSLKCAILLLDHESKNKELFGSVYKLNEVRSAFEIKSTQEEGSDVVCLSIEHTKINNGPKTKRVGLQIAFTGDDDHTEMAVFKKIDVGDIPELSKTLPLKVRIASELKHGQMSVALLAEALEQKEDLIRMTLNRHKDTFVKVGSDWGLLEKL